MRAALTILAILCFVLAIALSDEEDDTAVAQVPCDPVLTLASTGDVTVTVPESCEATTTMLGQAGPAGSGPITQVGGNTLTDTCITVTDEPRTLVGWAQVAGQWRPSAPLTAFVDCAWVGEYQR